MNKEELIQFLKDNLRIEFEVEDHFIDEYTQPEKRGYLTVSLGEEVINKSKFYLE